MKWFWKYVYRKLRDADNDQDVPGMQLGAKISATRSRHDSDLPDGGLNIQIKSAIGGKIVLFRTYDNRRDEHNWTTYLITDSEDFEKSLGKIITLESMKL